MAIFNKKLPTNLTEYPNSFKRQGSFPLEAYSVFYNIKDENNEITTLAFDAAKNYATSNPIAYVGQILTVIDEIEIPALEGEGTVVSQVATAYVIDNEAGDLKEVGSAPVGDETSITVDAETGTISLKGIDTLVFEREVDVLDEDGQPTGEKATEEIQYQPLMTKNGLAWIEPSKTTVEGLASLIDALSLRTSTIETKVSALENAVGAPAEGETSASGLFKEIADEIARAIEAEGNLEEELSGVVEELNTKIDLTTYNTDKTTLENGIKDAKDAAEKAQKTIDDFLTGDGIDPDVIETLKEIQAELKNLADVSDILTAIGKKADKVEGATAGNFASLDADGNLVDSGKKASDFATPDDVQTVDNKFANYTTSEELTNLLAGKQNTIPENTYDAHGSADSVKTWTEGQLATKANSDNVYTKEDIDNKISDINDSIEGIDSEVTDIVNNSLVNVIENITTIDDAKITVSKSGKTVTIDDSALVNLINNVKTTAESATSTNATNITSLGTQLNIIDELINGDGTTENLGILADIINLQADDKKHTAEFNALSKSVAENITKITELTTTTDQNKAAINAINNRETGILAQVDTKLEAKANASDVYTKTIIDEMIATATYNDTEIRALISGETERASKAEKANADAIAAIYTAGEGETPASGILAVEIARAIKADEDNATAIASLTERIGNVSNIMNFRGVVAKTDAGFDADLSNFKTEEEIDIFENGDVIIYGDQEYVYSYSNDTGVWILFGDATGNANAISALTSRVEVVEAGIPDAIAQAKSYTDQEIAKIVADEVTITKTEEGKFAVKTVSTDMLTQGKKTLVLNGGSADIDETSVED